MQASTLDATPPPTTYLQADVSTSRSARAKSARTASARSSARDPNTAICSWTEGNTQPQRDGTWMAAINIGPARTARTRRAASSGRSRSKAARTSKASPHLLDARDARPHHDGRRDDRRARARPTMLIWRSGDAPRQQQHATARAAPTTRNKMGVIKATSDGHDVRHPADGHVREALGLDGTHLGMSLALFGTTDALEPGHHVPRWLAHRRRLRRAGRAVIRGTRATNTFTDGGMCAVAPYDRHLYPNYLGNNPGNQGRNYSAPSSSRTRSSATNGSTDAYLMVSRRPARTRRRCRRQLPGRRRRLSAYITVIPVAQTPAVGATPHGQRLGHGHGTAPVGHGYDRHGPRHWRRHRHGHGD